jgi:CDGSH-type Zn-finger protein
MSSARPNPRIEVMPHGPYEVSGDVPLIPRTVATGADGEPLAWRSGAELAHPPTYYLCRCGQSRNKPHCDGSHAFELFDGTETASTEPSETRVEIHAGPGITVHKDGDLCIHAHFCNIEVTNWFEMIPETDDPRVRVQLIGMIEHCPSGALASEIDGDIVEPALPEAITPVPNGPLFVSGGIPVGRADDAPMEPRNRVTLCRCGGSANKPLCDGTHSEIGFEA